MEDFDWGAGTTLPTSLRYTRCLQKLIQISKPAYLIFEALLNKSQLKYRHLILYLLMVLDNRTL